MEKANLFNASPEKCDSRLITLQSVNPFEKKRKSITKITSQCTEIPLMFGQKYSCKHAQISKDQANLHEDSVIYGITNFSNTCWLAVCLQILVLCSDFVKDIIEIDNKYLRKSSACMIKMMALFFKAYQSGIRSEILAKTRLFKDLLEVKDSSYKGCTFQDAQESFLFILRLLSDSIKNNLQCKKM